jgi:hypothetical protein
MIRKIVIAAVAAAAATAAWASDLSPSPWASAQLTEMDAYGFGAPVDGMTWEGTVPGGQSGKIDMVIASAGKYAVVGSCGEDCGDIGLILDQGGKTVAQGVTGFRSDLPAGSYSLLVGFDNCKSTQCRYVVRAYQTKP